MNIDEALIERIIREVVSQVVDEKADGGGQNRSASGNNQNSMQSVNLGQIEQLVKNVASGDRQTSSGGQTSNAGGYHPEEPVHASGPGGVGKDDASDNSPHRCWLCWTKAEDPDAADSQGRSCQSKGCGYAGCASGCY